MIALAKSSTVFFSGVVIGCFVKGKVLDVGAITKLVVCISADGLHFRTTHQVPAKIDHVDAQVDQRPSTGSLLVSKPSTRISQTAQAGCFGVVDIPEVSRINELLQELSIRIVSSDKPDLQDLAAAFYCLLDFQSAFNRCG
jgi:hypothetical protein